MIDIKIRSESKQLARELRRDKDASRKAIKSTMGDLRRRGPAIVAKAVTSRYAIKAAEVKPSKSGERMAGGATIGIRGESIETFTLVYTGNLMTPIHFRMSPTAPSTGRRYTIKATILKGVRVKIGHWAPRGKDGGRYARPADSPFFLAAGNGGQVLPFQRKGGGLEAMRTVSLPQMVGNDEVADEAMAKLSELAEKRLKHNLSRFLK